jgi:hypothetical protein
MRAKVKRDTYRVRVYGVENSEWWTLEVLRYPKGERIRYSSNSRDLFFAGLTDVLRREDDLVREKRIKVRQ